MPAQANAHHDYWVFPLIVDEPRKLIDGLRAEGFDAAHLPRSQHIAAPRNRRNSSLSRRRISRDLIVIPCYDTMPDEELARQEQGKQAVGRWARPCESMNKINILRQIVEKTIQLGPSLSSPRALLSSSWFSSGLRFSDARTLGSFADAPNGR